MLIQYLHCWACKAVQDCHCVQTGRMRTLYSKNTTGLHIDTVLYFGKQYSVLLDEVTLVNSGFPIGIRFLDLLDRVQIMI